MPYLLKLLSSAVDDMGDVLLDVEGVSRVLVIKGTRLDISVTSESVYCSLSRASSISSCSVRSEVSPVLEWRGKTEPSTEAPVEVQDILTGVVRRKLKETVRLADG